MGVTDKLVSILVSIISFYYLQPIVNTVRLDTLQNYTQGLVMTFILMMFIPIIWLILSISSIMAIRQEIIGGQPQ